MAKEKMFKAADFTPTEWDTSGDKAKFANHFIRFAESDFKATLFYDWFYKRLSMTFGHIAHYNRAGFYGTFFKSTADKLRFLDRTLDPWTRFAGSPEFTYSDVEKALSSWLLVAGFREKYVERLKVEIETAERSTLATLKAKYEAA